MQKLDSKRLSTYMTSLAALAAQNGGEFSINLTNFNSEGTLMHKHEEVGEELFIRYKFVEDKTCKN